MAVAHQYKNDYRGQIDTDGWQWQCEESATQKTNPIQPDWASKIDKKQHDTILDDRFV